jgi:hypothetical protein
LLNLESSAHSFFANIVIRSGSREIERLSNYNLLHCALADYTLNKDYRGTSGCVMEGYGDGQQFFGAVTTLAAIEGDNSSGFSAALKDGIPGSQTEVPF